MNYFNVGKIVNTQGLQGEMRVLSVTDFAEERFKKGAELALFDEKDRFVQKVTIDIIKHKVDIIKPLRKSTLSKLSLKNSKQQPQGWKKT